MTFCTNRRKAGYDENVPGHPCVDLIGCKYCHIAAAEAENGSKHYCVLLSHNEKACCIKCVEALNHRKKNRLADWLNYIKP